MKARVWKEHGRWWAEAGVGFLRQQEFFETWRQAFAWALARQHWTSVAGKAA